MGEEYKAKIEVLLNNEGHVDMCLNGDTTTLQNLAISVLAQTIALGMDSWEAAKEAADGYYRCPPAGTGRGMERQRSGQCGRRQERGC